jgi:hypothetical protein
MTTKTTKTILFSILAAVFILWVWIVVNEKTQSSRSHRQTEKIGVESKTFTKYSVENVHVDKAYSNAWGVRGLIRNNSSMPITGSVKIKFLNNRGDVIHSYRAFVNDGDPLQSGQAGNFKYFTSQSDFDSITDFEVIFIER